ncbi:MAG TPA: AMP-binding protein [Jiangellaceae bacterium]|nr:AMP-binding protein [Jiangellaceae bacterium]
MRGGRTVRDAVAMGRDGAAALFGTGLVGPMHPLRLVRVVQAVSRYRLTLASAAEMSAIRHPDRVAVVDERGSLTFDDLGRRSTALADALHHDGLLREGGRLGLLCRNHRDFVIAAVAGSRVGADLVFLSTDLGAPALAGVLEREQVTTLVHDEEFTPLLDRVSFSGRSIVSWAGPGAPAPTLDQLSGSAAPPAPHPRSRGRLVVLTSGTTGTPKGAPRDAARLRMGLPVTSLLATLRLRSGEVMLIQPPIFHGYGLGFLAAALTLGCTAVLPRQCGAEEALQLVATHRVRVLACVPVLLHRIMRLPHQTRAKAETRSLRVIVSGAAALRPDLAAAVMNEYGDILFDLYGTTETGWATLATPADLRAAPGTVGRPAHGVTVAVLDADGSPLPRGQVGRVFVGSGLTFGGYSGGGTKAIVRGLMSTGDLGYLDDRGLLFVVGRADDMVVSGGENVHPREVEDLLAAHPAVADVVVYGVPDDEFGQRLAARVVRAPGATVTREDLVAFVAQTLGRHKVPRDVEFVARLDRTGSGKVRRPTRVPGAALRGPPRA